MKKKKLKELSMKSCPTIVADRDFMSKVEILCRNINSVEWSGILFYTIEGSIKSPDSMVIHLKDVLLMDIGQSSYTEFDWDEDFVNYKMSSPERMDYLHGLIHSHVDMNVFFSGTDKEELLENSTLNNFYLSVIVNNRLDMEAKLAIYPKSVKMDSKIVILDEQGNNHSIETQHEEEPNYVLVYDCNPVVIKNDSEEEILQRIKEIKNKTSNRYNSYNGYSINRDKNYNSYIDFGSEYKNYNENNKTGVYSSESYYQNKQEEEDDEVIAYEGLFNSLVKGTDIYYESLLYYIMDRAILNVDSLAQDYVATDPSNFEEQLDFISLCSSYNLVGLKDKIRTSVINCKEVKKLKKEDLVKISRMIKEFSEEHKNNTVLKLVNYLTHCLNERIK